MTKLTNSIEQVQRRYRLAYPKEECDCGVRALAVTCGVPYQEAHDVMARMGREQFEGASMWMVRCAAAQLGFHLHYITVKSKTMRQLSRELRDEPGAYMATTCDHVVGFWQGECIDWSRNRLTRIKEVYAIILRSNENEPHQL